MFEKGEGLRGLGWGLTSQGRYNSLCSHHSCGVFMSDGLFGWVWVSGEAFRSDATVPAEEPTTQTSSPASARIMLRALASLLVCFGITNKKKVSHSRRRRPLCAHMDTGAAGGSITCLFCSVLTEPPHPKLHSLTVGKWKGAVLKL